MIFALNFINFRRILEELSGISGLVPGDCFSRCVLSFGVRRYRAASSIFEFKLKLNFDLVFHLVPRGDLLGRHRDEGKGSARQFF